jgi:UDP-N-acetylglucosamine/UDP-N-acetylgalactosamine diphosphorylase
MQHMSYHAAEVLTAHGIRLPAPSAAWVSTAVSLARISRRGVVVHPGCRIEGEATLIGEGAEIGTHGPVVLKDAALGKNTRIAGGAVEGAVLLDGASLGPDSHVRAGTLLEEGASTGHGVGLKQTVLMAYATLGSLINFCDCLLSGGRSRNDHSEVGSGFILQFHAVWPARRQGHPLDLRRRAARRDDARATHLPRRRGRRRGSGADRLRHRPGGGLGVSQGLR